MYRRVKVYLHGQLAGHLVQTGEGYAFTYLPDYTGRAISLSMPVTQASHFSAELHPFFKGLAPEGWLKKRYAEIQKIDEKDLLGILIANSDDLLGAITLKAEPHV